MFPLQVREVLIVTTTFFRYFLTISACWMVLHNPGCRKGGDEGAGDTGYYPVTAESEPPSVGALVSEEESGGLTREPGCTLFWFETKERKWSVVGDFDNDVFTAAAANDNRDVIAAAGISYTWPSLSTFFKVYELPGEGESPYLKFAVKEPGYGGAAVIFSEYDSVFYVSVPASVAGRVPVSRANGVKEKRPGSVILAYDEKENVLEEVVTTSRFVRLKGAFGKRILWVDIYEEPDIRRSAILDLDTGELSPAGYDSSGGCVPPLIYYSTSRSGKPPYVVRAYVTFSDSSEAGPDVTLGDYVNYPVLYSFSDKSFVFLEDPVGEGPPHLKVKRIETGKKYSYELPPLNWRKNYVLLSVD